MDELLTGFEAVLDEPLDEWEAEAVDELLLLLCLAAVADVEDELLLTFAILDVDEVLPLPLLDGGWVEARDELLLLAAEADELLEWGVEADEDELLLCLTAALDELLLLLCLAGRGDELLLLLLLCLADTLDELLLDFLGADVDELAGFVTLDDDEELLLLLLELDEDELLTGSRTSNSSTSTSSNKKLPMGPPNQLVNCTVRLLAENGAMTVADMHTQSVVAVILMPL